MNLFLYSIHIYSCIIHIVCFCSLLFLVTRSNELPIRFVLFMLLLIYWWCKQKICNNYKDICIFKYWVSVICHDKFDVFWGLFTFMLYLFIGVNKSNTFFSVYEHSAYEYYNHFTYELLMLVITPILIVFMIFTT